MNRIKTIALLSAMAGMAGKAFDLDLVGYAPARATRSRGTSQPKARKLAKIRHGHQRVKHRRA